MTGSRGEHRKINQLVQTDPSGRNDELPIREDLVLQSLSNEVGEEMIPFLVERFRSDLQTHLAGIICAVQASDGLQLERESHTLKSVSGTFGAKRLQEQMRLVNESCRRGDIEEALKFALNVEVVGKLTLEAYIDS